MLNIARCFQALERVTRIEFKNFALHDDFMTFELRSTRQLIVNDFIELLCVLVRQAQGFTNLKLDKSSKQSVNLINTYPIDAKEI